MLRSAFASYSVDDIHSWTASAMLGALISANTNTFRVPAVRIRVGDYKFDNTNFAGGGFGGGARYDLRGFPLDDDPLAIRQFLWLATDSAYKGSLQSIARKRSASTTPRPGRRRRAASCLQGIQATRRHRWRCVRRRAR